MKFNSVTIAPIRSLEVGDLIAREFLGTIISGEITGIVFCAADLTDEQRQYMHTHELYIPESKWMPLGGRTSSLIFGKFHGYGVNQNQPQHMYVEHSTNVAVFPYHPRPDREVVDTPPI